MYKKKIISVEFYYIKYLEILHVFKIVLEEILELFLQLLEVLRSRVSACNTLKYRAQNLTNCLQLDG